jgi:hypothetical protein
VYIVHPKTLGSGDVGGVSPLTNKYIVHIILCILKGWVVYINLFLVDKVGWLCRGVRLKIFLYIKGANSATGGLPFVPLFLGGVCAEWMAGERVGPRN